MRGVDERESGEVKKVMGREHITDRLIDWSGRAVLCAFGWMMVQTNERDAVFENTTCNNNAIDDKGTKED